MLIEHMCLDHMRPGELSFLVLLKTNLMAYV